MVAGGWGGVGLAIQSSSFLPRRPCLSVLFEEEKVNEMMRFFATPTCGFEIAFPDIGRPIDDLRMGKTRLQSQVGNVRRFRKRCLRMFNHPSHKYVGLPFAVFDGNRFPFGGLFRVGWLGCGFVGL